MSAPNITPEPSNQPEYEFTANQNNIISELARKMNLVGVFLVIVGILGLIGGLIGNTEGGSFIQGLLNLLMGKFTIDGAKAFQKVVSTQGKDISNLMEGLHSVSKVYGIIYWIIVIALIFLAVMVVLLLLGVIGGGIFGLIKR
jgi:hypothetical protein